LVGSNCSDLRAPAVSDQTKATCRLQLRGSASTSGVRPNEGNLSAPKVWICESEQPSTLAAPCPSLGRCSSQVALFWSDTDRCRDHARLTRRSCVVLV